MPTKDNTPSIYNTGDSIYRIYPSALGAKELTVTTPEITVTPANNLVVKEKEYQATPLGLMSALWDKYNGTNFYYQDKNYTGEINADNRSAFERNLAYQLQHNNTPLGYMAQTVIPTGAVAATLTGVGYGAGALGTAVTGGADVAIPMAIDAFKYGIPMATGALVGSKAVDETSRLLTGMPFSDYANKMTNGSIGDIYNPGIYVGGALGKYGTTRALTRLRKSAFHNLTPFGYANTISGAPSKASEIKDWLKDAIDLRHNWNIDVSPTAVPKWKTRLLDANNYDPEISLMSDFREEAYRKALKLPSKYPLYLDNGNGTWRYNTDFINQRRKLYAQPTLNQDPTFVIDGSPNNASFLSGDTFTGNGGYVRMVNNYNGTYTMQDRWDIHPFSDDRALFTFPGSKHVEMMQVLDGNPFMLNHTFRPRYFEYPPRDPSLIHPRKPKNI